MLLGEMPDGRSGRWGGGECEDEDGGEREVDGETVGQIEKGDGGKVECGTWMVPLSP